MNVLEIRLATTDDYEALTALEANVQAIHVEGAPEIYKPGGVISEENYYMLLNSPNNIIVLGICAGELVGYMHCEIVERPETDLTYARRTLHIHALSIKQEQRRKGYGRRLMESAIERAKEAKIERVTLDVADFNRDAYAFYARLGFAPMQIRMICLNRSNAECQDTDH